MNVLVTGATGFIGTPVVSALLDHGHQVSGLVRTADAAQALPAGVRPVVGDLTSPSTLTPLVAGTDAVVHLAAVAGPDLPTVDRAAALALLAGLHENNVMIYTSGAAVPGDTGDGIGTESTVKDPASFAAWRGQTEDALAAAAGPAVRLVIIRPSVIVYGGAGAGIAGRMLETASRTGTVPYPAPGTARLSTVRVEDIADLYCRAVETSHADGVFIAASDDVVTVADIAGAVARLTGAAPTPLTADQGRDQLGMLSALLATNVVVSGRRARTELGWQPRADGLLADLATPAPWVTRLMTARSGRPPAGQEG